MFDRANYRDVGASKFWVGLETKIIDKVKLFRSKPLPPWREGISVEVHNIAIKLIQEVIDKPEDRVIDVIKYKVVDVLVTHAFGRNKASIKDVLRIALNGLLKSIWWTLLEFEAHLEALSF